MAPVTSALLDKLDCLKSIVEVPTEQLDTTVKLTLKVPEAEL
jgi:hypothetical protein